ncbi:MAG: TRAP transporter small permease [Oscillospiraceae bacterium]|nr:TRAP transporter small permease [Oscillospiraceae bacterium]
MKVLDAIKKVFDKILEVLGTIALGLMSILVVYQVITRYFFNAPSAYSEALSQYLFVWMIMFGSAYVYGSLEHLTIDLLKDKFPPKMNLVVEIITNICLFAFILLICVIGGRNYTLSQVKRIDPSLHISMAILYASVPFTGIVTLFYSIYNIARSIRNYRDGKRKTGDPLGGTA